MNEKFLKKLFLISSIYFIFFIAMNVFAQSEDEIVSERDVDEYKVKDKDGVPYVRNKKSMFVAEELKIANEKAVLENNVLFRLTITNHFDDLDFPSFLIIKLIKSKDQKKVLQCKRYNFNPSNKETFTIEKTINKDEKFEKLLSSKSLVFYRI